MDRAMLEYVKELFNYGVLGIFAAFILWGIVKGCRALYQVLFSPGDELNKVPRGLAVRLVDYIQSHLAKTENFLDRTATVLVGMEERDKLQQQLCQVHNTGMQTIISISAKQEANTASIADDLQRFADLQQASDVAHDSRTHKQLCAIQSGMVEACEMCKMLANRDPSIADIVGKHCDEIVRIVEGSCSDSGIHKQ